MEINILKIIIAGLMFSSLIFIKKKYKWTMALALTAYLVLIGVNII